MTNANVLKPRLKGAASLIGHGLAMPLVGIRSPCWHSL